MTVEMIDKMGLTYKEWLEILGLCELLFNGLCETYCQKKVDQQLALGRRAFDKIKNFCYNIITERKKLQPFYWRQASLNLFSHPAATLKIFDKSR